MGCSSRGDAAGCGGRGQKLHELHRAAAEGVGDRKRMPSCEKSIVRARGVVSGEAVGQCCREGQAGEREE